MLIETWTPGGLYDDHAKSLGGRDDTGVGEQTLCPDELKCVSIADREGFDSS